MIHLKKRVCWFLWQLSWIFQNSEETYIFAKIALPVFFWIKWDKSVPKRLGCGHFCLRYFRQVFTHPLLFQPSRRSCFSRYLSKKMSSVGHAWVCVNNLLSNCYRKVSLNKLRHDQFCKYFKVFLNVCWRCWVCRIWDLDFRNCNLLKDGPPPSNLLSSAKFVIL